MSCLFKMITGKIKLLPIGMFKITINKIIQNSLGTCARELVFDFIPEHIILPSDKCLYMHHIFKSFKFFINKMTRTGMD